MNSTLIMDLIYIGVILLISLLMMLIPLKALAVITTPFSFKTFGIRKIKRLYSRADTLGTIMIVISLLLALLFPFIPYGPIVYGLWLTFSYLCALSRAVRLTEVPQTWKKEMVVFLLTFFFGLALVCGLGFLNDYALWTRSILFFQDLLSKEAWHVMYFLNSSRFLCWLCQFFIMAFSTCYLWNQFKYMRLENTFHGANIFTYLLKTLFWSALVAMMSLFGPRILEKAYQASAEDIAQSHLASFPYDLSYQSDLSIETEEDQKDSDQDASKTDQSSDKTEDSSKPDENKTKTPDEGTPSDNPETPAENAPDAQNPEGEEPAPVQ